MRVDSSRIALKGFERRVNMSTFVSNASRLGNVGVF